MIVDLYSVPSEKNILRYLGECGTTVSVRQSVEESGSNHRSEVIIFTSTTKYFERLSENLSLLGNYVTSVRTNPFEIDSTMDACTVMGPVESMTSSVEHYVISVLDEKADKDIAIFCNGAFVALEDSLSISVIRAINNYLNKCEVDKALQRYQSMSNLKTKEGEPLLPTIEAFEKQEKVNGALGTGTNNCPSGHDGESGSSL